MARRVALVAVGAVLASLAAHPGPAEAVTVTTQNVAHTLGPVHARHDIRQAAERSSVVLGQEMGGRVAARYAPAGWGAAHVWAGSRGDCATFWDRHVWHVVTSYVVRVARAPFRAGHRWALVVVLARPGLTLATVNVHVFTHTRARRPAFHRAENRLRAVARTLVARWGHVVMGGDWNRPYASRMTFPGFTSRRPPRDTGPRGGRVDYVYAHGLTFAGVRVIGRTYSDHQATRARLRPGK